MAIDTRQKRMSIMNLMRFPATNLFQADSVVDADDRVHLLALYTGFFSSLTPCIHSLTTIIESRGIGIDSLITATLGLSSPITATLGVTTGFTITKGIEANITGTSLGLDGKFCE